MQAQLSFLEEKAEDGAVPVWSTLDDEQRAEVVATLARLIVTLTVTTDGEKMNHE